MRHKNTSDVIFEWLVIAGILFVAVAVVLTSR